MSQSIIAIDWGSTNIRGYLIEEDRIIHSLASEDKLNKFTSTNCFINRIQEIIAVLAQGNSTIPVYLSGMIGSASGWIKTEYVPCPLNIHNLSNHLVKVSNKETIENPVFIVPGVAVNDPESNHFDVMRGEEIQILGALNMKDYDLIVLPGTHSKWANVRTENNQHTLLSFSTYITGELFENLCSHSLLKPVMKTKTIHTGAFCIGLDEAILKKNCFESLFSVRSRSLLGNIQGADSASYLSGILIGSELIGNFSSLNTSKNIAFIGNKNLLNLYETALNHYRICAKIDFLKSEDVLVNAYTNFSHE